MFVLAERMPVVFKAHMVSSAGALLLIPAVIAMRRQPDVHRMLGRLLGAFVVIGGLTALPVAIFSHSSLAARAGFFVQGLVWMALFAAATTMLAQLPAYALPLLWAVPLLASWRVAGGVAWRTRLALTTATALAGALPLVLAAWFAARAGSSSVS